MTVALLRTKLYAPISWTERVLRWGLPLVSLQRLD